MQESHVTSKDLIAYYENEAHEVPIFGSLREISLAENIMRAFPKGFTSLIDVGCGDGYLLFKVRQKYPRATLYGLDVSSGRLMTTKKKVPLSHLVRSNVFSLPFPNNSFDVVVCSELLEHMENYETVVDELVRISKRQIIITVPNELPLVKVMCPRCKTKHYLDGHVNFFTEQRARAVLHKRKDAALTCIKKFHSIYTYNTLTMKFPLGLRLLLDTTLLRLHTHIGFLKPNYLMAVLEKKVSRQQEKK